MGIDYLAAIGKRIKRGRGRPPGPRQAKASLIRLYLDEGSSLRATAAALGITKDTARRALKAAGIERRSCVKRSRLRAYSLDTIEKAIQADGLKSTAAALGVSLRALQYYRAGLRAGTNPPPQKVDASGKSGRKKAKNRGKGGK